MTIFGKKSKPKPKQNSVEKKINDQIGNWFLGCRINLFFVWFNENLDVKNKYKD